MRGLITLLLITAGMIFLANNAEAGCVGTSVGAFGAKGDGHTDDTAAIQRAINAAAVAGGGTVVFSVARYYTTGTFVLPQGVVFCGAVEGPFDVVGTNPATVSTAPTLLVTNRTRWPLVFCCT